MDTVPGDSGIDGDDIRHGEKGGEAGADLGEEESVFALAGLSLLESQY